MRSELENSIRYEEHRSNVDTAKKAAVKQLMDYENFHQMVLGADLKPLKTLEMKDLINNEGYRPEMIFNHCSTEDNGPQITLINPDASNTLNLATNEEPIDQQNQESFQAIQVKTYSDYKSLFQIALTNKPTPRTEQRLLNFLMVQDKSSYRRIFSMEYEIEYFSKLMDIMLKWTKDDQLFIENRQKISWYVQFLLDLAALRKFKIVIKEMLKTAEKIMLKKLLIKINEKNPALEEYVAEVRSKYF